MSIVGTITIGADVEVFAQTKDGHHISLCDKIGGTKEKPLQCPDLARGYMVQEDNVSLEYNIPPARSAKELTASIAIMRDKCTSILEGLDLVLSTNASFSFTQEQLTHPKALIFGCEPDYNAWSKMENKKPISDDPTLRTCGGHIHVGTATVDMLDGIKAMDLFLGVPSVLLDDSPASINRRQMYGKSGAMRPKPYGFEYRVLSNFWMFDNYLVDWIFNNTIKAMVWSKTTINRAEADLIQRCINTGDKDLAASLIASYNIPMPNKSEYDESFNFSLLLGRNRKVNLSGATQEMWFTDNPLLGTTA